MQGAPLAEDAPGHSKSSKSCKGSPAKANQSSAGENEPHAPTSTHGQAISSELGPVSDPNIGSASDFARNATPGFARVLRDVLRIAWPVTLSYIAVGLPCGVLAAKAGMTPLMAAVISATFLTGGGQFMISNLWIAGTPMLSLLASVAAISTRFALYSASLAPYLKRFNKRQSLAITSCFTEEAYGITLSKLAEGPSWTAAHAITLNLALVVSWTIPVTLGAMIGAAVDIPTALASFAMTSLFIYLLYSQPHTRGNLCAAAAAVITVGACKAIGASGIAVPTAAVIGVMAGMLSLRIGNDDEDTPAKAQAIGYAEKIDDAGGIHPQSLCSHDSATYAGKCATVYAETSETAKSGSQTAMGGEPDER